MLNLAKEIRRCTICINLSQYVNNTPTRFHWRGHRVGLSLSYDIVVKGYGGKIDLESKEGEGSEFTVTLPI